MSESECIFHSKSEEDWTGESMDVNMGVLGKGLIKANVTEDEKVLEITLVSPDTSNYLSWKIPVSYCPVCGKRL